MFFQALLGIDIGQVLVTYSMLRKILVVMACYINVISDLVVLLSRSRLVCAICYRLFH